MTKNTEPMLPKLEKNVNLTERIISLVSGSLLLCSAFSGRARLLKGLTGGLLVFRGASGYCPAYDALGYKTAGEKDYIHISTTVAVDRPRQEVYAFWRKLDNLPSFMKHLESVEVLDEQTSEWTLRIPGGVGTVSWKSSIIKDEPDTHLSWRSLPGSDIENTGFVDFRDTQQLGTVVHVVIAYYLPAGKVGEGVAKLFNPVFEKMVRDDIRNFRSYMEKSR